MILWIYTLWSPHNMTRKQPSTRKVFSFGPRMKATNELYKAHVASNKVQRKASTVLEIDLNFQKNSFISKAPLSLALQVGNKVTKSSSPINRRLQQEEHTTFEKKKKNIFIKNLFVYKSLKNYICFEQAALFVY